MSACNAHLTATSGVSRALSDNRPSPPPANKREPTPGSRTADTALPTGKALPTRSSFPRMTRRESSLFQRGMDSGSALRFARNDGFDQSLGQSSQPTPLPPALPNATARTDYAPDGPRCPEQTPAALSCPETHLTPNGNHVAAWHAQIPPEMTDLSACSNGPPARRQPIQSQQAKPAALGCPKTHLTPRATALPNGRHTNPAIDDQPFGISERSIGPLTTDPASQSRQPGQLTPCRSNPGAIRAR